MADLNRRIPVRYCGKGVQWQGCLIYGAVKVGSQWRRTTVNGTRMHRPCICYRYNSVLPEMDFDRLKTLRDLFSFPVESSSSIAMTIDSKSSPECRVYSSSSAEQIIPMGVGARREHPCNTTRFLLELTCAYERWRSQKADPTEHDKSTPSSGSSLPLSRLLEDSRRADSADGK